MPYNYIVSAFLIGCQLELPKLEIYITWSKAYVDEVLCGQYFCEEYVLYYE